MNLLMITRVLLEVKNLKLFLQLPKLMNMNILCETDV